MIQKRPVWDLPTRVFHWGLAVSVFLSMLIVYGKKYIALHYSPALLLLLMFCALGVGVNGVWLCMCVVAFLLAYGVL